MVGGKEKEEEKKEREREREILRYIVNIVSRNTFRVAIYRVNTLAAESRSACFDPGH